MYWLKRITLWILLATGVVIGSSFAQNALDSDPARALIERLTETPVDTWLDAGTVKVIHTAYKAPAITDPLEIENRIQQAIQTYQNNPHKPQLTLELQQSRLNAIPFNIRYDYENESTTTTQEEIRFDGELFRHEITILSHTDSIQPDASLASNPYTGDLILEYNRKQVMTYDGERFAHYFESANHSLEEDPKNSPDKPRTLSVGMIPWGYGLYTKDNLLKSRPGIGSDIIDGKTYTRLTFTFETGIRLEILLDPDTLAIYHRTLTWANGAILSDELSNHVQVNGRWVPTDIYEEQLTPEATGYRLLSWDTWQLDIVSTEPPRREEYTPDYKEGAAIHYSSPLSKSTQQYYYHNGVNTEALLSKRLNAIAAQNSGAANCATLVLQEAASELGRSITVPSASLIDANGFTCLADMQQCLQDQGIYCKAVQTTIQQLADYSAKYAVILYLPTNKHYVLLESMDSDNVWTLDLGSNTFYRPTPVNVFSRQWSGGTALLVSNEPIQNNDPALTDAQLRTIVGSGWQCVIVQETWQYTSCSLYPPCNGYLWLWLELWDCISVPTEEECTATHNYINYIRFPCILKIETNSCYYTGLGAYVALTWGCNGTQY